MIPHWLITVWIVGAVLVSGLIVAAFIADRSPT